MKKVAVVLSGCGYKDGSEITETVSTLVSLTQYDAEYSAFALDSDVDCTNHINDQAAGQRNAMEEASRITRGKIQPLEALNPDDFDGIVFPGGFGAALHLCDWAKAGANCTVNPHITKIITEFHQSSKPICAICIAPALIAKVLGDQCTVTIGSDADTANEIKKTGAGHENCDVTDYVSDRESKVISTPAYMFDEAKASEVFTGINKAIKEFVEMA